MTRQEILRNKWVSFGRWMQPTISGIGWTYCHDTDVGRIAFPDKEFTQLLFLDGHTLIIGSDQDWYRTQARYFVDPAYAEELTKLAERFEEAGQEAEKRHLALLATENLSDAEYLRELFRTYREMTGIWWIAIPLCIALEKEAVQHGYANGEGDLGAKVAPYHRQTWLERQSAEIRRMAGEIKERYPDMVPEKVTEEFVATNSGLMREVEEHVREFVWFGTHHWNGEPYSIEKCIADIRGALARGSFETSRATKALDTEHEALWKFIALCMYWRTHCAEATAKVIYGARERLTNVAERWSMSYDDLTWLTGQEILEGIGSDKKDFSLPANYAQRRAGYGTYLDGDNERVVTGPELAELLDAIVPKVDTAVSKVRGTVASKGGIVTGTARIVMSPADFPRFEEGDILVANETTPDFVPLMKKAAAIVTDTGGITSHAGIVSRELKVPCVTGTKTATQVFDDGESIEVDATTGIVRRSVA